MKTRIFTLFLVMSVTFSLFSFASAQGIVKYMVLDNADSTNVFETGVASKDTSLAMQLNDSGYNRGSRCPKKLTMIVPTSEDDDSTNVISKLLFSGDGSLGKSSFYEWTAARDTIITEDGSSVIVLTDLPCADEFKYSVEARMAAADSVDVGPVQIIVEY